MVKGPRQGLKAEGIDTTFVRRDPVRTTGSAFIMVFPNRNNCIVVDPAANFSLTPVDIERAKDVIERANAPSKETGKRCCQARWRESR